MANVKKRAVKKNFTARFDAAHLGRPSSGRDCRKGLRTNDDVVANGPDVLHAAGNVFSLHFLGVGLGKAGQLNRTIERFNVDGQGRNCLVLHELGFHGGGDGRVVDIGASGFLATYNSATAANDGDACQCGKCDCADFLITKVAAVRLFYLAAEI